MQEIDEGDQAILDNYMPAGQLGGGQTLADLIMQKIDEQEEGKETPQCEWSSHIGATWNRRGADACEPSARREPPPGFNPKIAEVYTKCVLTLAYRSPR